MRPARLLLTGLAVLLCATAVSAHPLVSPLYADLDGDGSSETVGLRSYQREGETYGQLVVQSEDGKLTWQGPRQESSFVFLGPYDHGTLQLLFRHNGEYQLLASYQKSDVRPTRFRLFRWNGKAFEHLRDGSLLSVQQRPGVFIWGQDPAASRWVESFLGQGGGWIEAQVTDLSERTQKKVRMRLVGQEFVLAK